MKLLLKSLLVFFSLNVTVFAATAPLPQTGQTACYDTAGTVINCTGTGQDGEFKRGVAPLSLRFKDNGNQTITDTMTNLIWAKNANLMKSRDPQFVTDFPISGQEGLAHWPTALDYVKKLNAENYLGYNDWRLPNLNEL